jgi:endonuclease-8
MLTLKTKTPEGPEVRNISDELNRFVGMTIREAFVISGRYARGSLDLSKMKNAQIMRVIVKGKLLAFVLSNNEEVFAALSTLGMTGEWCAQMAPPTDARIELTLTGAGEQTLYFNDPRNFGTFKVVSYVEMRRKLAELGPDIMVASNLWGAIAIPEFKARITRFGKALTLAEGLLDQRIVSGVGNYIRSDAMFLARMSPHRPISGLSDDELRTIWHAMYTIAVSSYANVHPGDMVNPNSHFEHLCYGHEELESYHDKHGHVVFYNKEIQA